jgi:AraC-like DNA-binding protein
MTATGDQFSPVTFSTRNLPPRLRLAAYRDMLNMSVGNFEVDAVDELFEFRADSLALPGLGIAHIASSALRVERALKAAPDADRDLVLAVVHDGAASTMQRGREVSVSSSGAFLSSSHEPLVMRRTAARLTNYSLRRSDLAPAVANLDGVLLTAMPVDSEAMRLLTGYSALAFRTTPVSIECARLAVSHMHDLIALAIGATRDAAEIAKTRGLRAARHVDLYARARRLIALRCEESDLAPGEIAHRLGVSLGLLQKVFAERGETILTHLWNERVSRAARLLSAPEAADHSITHIAFACGFTDSGHFGRVFAAHMGMAPSRWRVRAREEPGDRIESRRRQVVND